MGTFEELFENLSQKDWQDKVAQDIEEQHAQQDEQPESLQIRLEAEVGTLKSSDTARLIVTGKTGTIADLFDAVVEGLGGKIQSIKTEYV